MKQCHLEAILSLHLEAFHFYAMQMKRIHQFQKNTDVYVQYLTRKANSRIALSLFHEWTTLNPPHSQVQWVLWFKWELSLIITINFNVCIYIKTTSEFGCHFHVRQLFSRAKFVSVLCSTVLFNPALIFIRHTM